MMENIESVGEQIAETIVAINVLAAATQTDTDTLSMADVHVFLRPIRERLTSAADALAAIPHEQAVTVAMAAAIRVTDRVTETHDSR